MSIEDFLPKYPNINNTEYPLLNPYGDNFYNNIFHKKEFYEERLDKTEEIPTEKGAMMKNQKLIARFLSSHTLYDELLLVHEMGTGKTCAAIGAIEQIKGENSTFKGAYVFAKGVNLLNNFIKELRDKCTAGQYIPKGSGVREAEGDDEGELTEKMITIRTKKLFEEYYHFSIGVAKPTTFETFAKHLTKMTDNDIITTYSNYIHVIDEVHGLRPKSSGDEDDAKESKGDRLLTYQQFHRFLHLVKNCKIILLSGTPMKDGTEEIA